MPQQNLPEKTLYPSKLKGILLLLMIALFVAVGIWMINSGESKGWFVAIGFGLGFLILAVNLLPQASYLKLDKEGFEFSSLFRKHKYYWTEVNHFSAGSIANNKMVMFDFSEAYNKAKKSRKVATALSGSEAALHDTFGMKAQDLADLMNEYKQAFAS